ncbi:hypothetical protein YT1_4159 [Rhodococcus ruber]|nr:hypothetical protein YT1_4159 [Rhodococcus ruber]
MHPVFGLRPALREVYRGTAGGRFCRPVICGPDHDATSDCFRF